MSNTKFVHTVYFWLKKDLSQADRDIFKKALLVIEKIPTVVYFNVGTPAQTDRPVIDRSYDFALLTVFKDNAGHDAYQTDPIHLAFLDTCRHMWEKVLIYDSVNY
jgi:hypothetical protein